MEVGPLLIYNRRGARAKNMVGLATTPTVLCYCYNLMILVAFIKLICWFLKVPNIYKTFPLSLLCLCGVSRPSYSYICNYYSKLISHDKLCSTYGHSFEFLFILSRAHAKIVRSSCQPSYMAIFMCVVQAIVIK